MARNDQKLQVATRDEIDLYESAESDVEFHDFEDDDEDIVGTSTVKLSDRRGQEAQPSNSGWPANAAPLRSPSPTKQLVHPRSPPPSKSITQVRSGSQVTTPAQSRYAKSDTSGVLMRSSATSSTAATPASPSISTFGSNLPRSAVKPKKYDALEDIVLPALDDVCHESYKI